MNLDEHVKIWKTLERKKYYKNWRSTHKYDRDQRNLEWEERYRQRKKYGLVYGLALGIRFDEHVKVWKELERKRRHNETSKRSAKKLGDRRVAQWRKWAIENKDKMKQYYVLNHDIIRKRGRQYYVKNQDRMKKNMKESYIRNRENRLKAVKEWQTKNPEKILASNRRHLNKIAKPWNISSTAMMCALNSWAKTIKKVNNCIICQKPAKYAHHLLHKKSSPNLCLNPNNGVPLCKRCHDEHHCKNLRGMKPLEPILDIRNFAWVRIK